MISELAIGGARLSIDTQREFVLIRWVGVVTSEAHYEILDRITQLPGWTPRCGRLVIYERSAKMGEVGLREAQALFEDLKAWHVRHHPGHFVRAASVVKRGSIEPMIQLWQQVARESAFFEIQWFRTLEEALAWMTEPEYQARRP